MRVRAENGERETEQPHYHPSHSPLPPPPLSPHSPMLSLPPSVFCVHSIHREQLQCNKSLLNKC